MEQSSGVMVFSMLYYTSLFILVVFLLLVFVHFTIVPIFALTADNPGIIVISGAGDRELSYTDTSYPASSLNRRTPPGKTTSLKQCFYTIGFNIKKGTALRTPQRTAVLYRAAAVTTQSLSTINSCTDDNCFIFNDTNILVSTTKDASDLITVEIVNSKGERKAMDNNISLTALWQRVSIVLADTFAEVYLNGTQIATIVVDNLKQVASTTDFYPPTNTNVEISHMSMWPRILSPKEIRYYESEPMS